MKKFLALGLAAAVTIGLTACGENAQPVSTAPHAAVELDVVTSYGGDDGNRSTYEKAYKAWENATGNIVKDASTTSTEEWKGKVHTDFEAGSEPDVLFYFTNADAEPFVKAGKVVPIDTIRAEYPDYAANMRDDMMAVAGDGKRYSVPGSGFWENMFVNKNVLAAAGVAVPGSNYTWEQFLADCETIKKAGYTPIACSLFQVPHYWFEFTVMNNGGADDHLKLPMLDEEGKLVMNEAAEHWVAGLNDIKALYEAGYFPENTLTAGDADTRAMFGTDEAAFLIDGSWRVGDLVDMFPENAENFAVAYVPGKQMRSANEAIGGISMGWFITERAWKNEAKRAAAVDFVSYMTSDEVMSSFVTTEMTALKGGAAPTGLAPLYESAAAVNSKIARYVGAVQDTLDPAVRTDLFASVQKIVTGEMTPEAAIEAALAAALDTEESGEPGAGGSTPPAEG